MLEQKGKHSYIPQRASLPPAARPAERDCIYPPQYDVRSPTTQRPVSDGEYDDVWPVRMSSSARRYQGLATTDDQEIIQQGNKRIIIHHGLPPGKQQQPKQHVQTEPVTKSRQHWLFWLGCIFCIMLLGWTVLSFLSGFLQQKRDDLLYGNPRTFQTDAVVGHYNRISHFVALNLDGYIEIFETQRNHPEAAKIYTPSALTINPTDPITLSFQDVNGDGKIDMIISTPSFQEVMFNTGTSFQSQPPAPNH